MDIDKNLWQPPSLYTQFFSNSGCQFILTANFIEEEEMIERRRRLKSGTNQMAKMRNKLQAVIDGHIEEDFMNRYAIQKWNKRIQEHKRNLRRWENDARAASHNMRK